MRNSRRFGQVSDGSGRLCGLKIATYNVNGIKSRLPVLLRWLGETQPDIVCLQEVKTSDETFPIAAIEEAGYGAIWHGQKSYNGVAILARGAQPEEICRGLPGDPDDTHSRYIEARVHGLTVGCLYLPNGNPAPGPRFEYKLAWFERLIDHAAVLLESGGEAALCGDYNAVPTPLDAYRPERWVGDAVFFPETRDAYARLVGQGWGRNRDANCIRARRVYLLGLLPACVPARRRAAADDMLLSPSLAPKLRAAEVDCQARGWGRTPRLTHLSGSNWIPRWPRPPALTVARRPRPWLWNVTVPPICRARACTSRSPEPPEFVGSIPLQADSVVGDLDHDTSRIAPCRGC